MSGAHDIVVAAGVEVMSLVYMGASVMVDSVGAPFGPTMGLRYADQEQYPGHKGLVAQGISAEIIADKWGISREELDAFALQSQERAAQATAEGRFANEIIPVAEKRI